MKYVQWGIWFIRTYNEGYIIIYNVRIYPLPLCMCRWQSTFEIHMKTSSLLYLRSRLFFFFLLTTSTAAVNTNKYERTW